MWKGDGVKRAGNIMVRNAIEYIKICFERKIPGYLENPRSSMIFQVPWIRRKIKEGSLVANKVDFCQYGTPFKKPTTFLTWGFKVNLHTCTATNRRCSFTNSFHEVLTGISNGKFRTSAAQMYPRKLAKNFMTEFLKAEHTHPQPPERA